MGAIFAARAMHSVLYGLSVFPFTTFAGAAAVMTLVCLFASCLPALRATRVDPIEALRTE
jgi:ABC-type antimicrobial peptide transport system permease subunit